MISPGYEAKVFGKSEHQQKVEEFHVGMHLDTPSQPVMPSTHYLLARAKLLMEEVMEYIEASGVEVGLNKIPTDAKVRFDNLTFSNIKPPDLVEMADGLADTLVVATGGLVICGISDKPLLQEVDDNNLLKLKTGHYDWHSGKYIKAKDHPKPDIKKVLKDQGWSGE